MKSFVKNGAWYVEFTVREGELLGLYEESDGRRGTRETTRADGRVRKYGKERGLGTDRRDQAMTLILIFETAFEQAVKNPAALRFLTDIVRDQKLAMSTALSLWTAAQERVGKNATQQLEWVLAVRAKIELQPLVPAWNGGAAAAVRHQARNMAIVNRLLRWYRAETGEEMTVEHLTPRLLDAYLLGMREEVTKFSNGKKLSKRTVIYHRAAINVFCRWLMTPTAANAAGLAVDQYVLERNPVDLIVNEEVTQTRKDLRKWKKNRVCYTQDEAKAIVNAIGDVETRAAVALMFGSMLEFGGLYNLDGTKGPRGPVLFKRNFRRDENGQFTRWFHAAGLINVTGNILGPGLDKAETRVRDLEVPDAHGFDFYWRVVESYLRTLRENDPFISHHPRYYKKRFEAALKTLGIPRQHGRLFHPCRHTFAQFWVPLVMSGRGGQTMVRGKRIERDLDWVKQQAGHEERSVVLFTTYTKGEQRQGAGEQVLSEEMSRKRRGLAIA